MKVEVVDPMYMPKKGSEHSAGFDLCACIDPQYVPMEFYTTQDCVGDETIVNTYSIKLGPLNRICIKTGIKIAIDHGYYGRIAPRSGLAFNSGIDTLAGVIDSDYRGDVGVILYNTSKKNSITINNGNRIAQLVIEKIYTGGLRIVSSVAEYLPTARGEGGFGSTGVGAMAGVELIETNAAPNVEHNVDAMLLDSSCVDASAACADGMCFRAGRTSAAGRDKDPI